MKSLYLVLVVALITIAGAAQAADTCGGFVEFSKDCGNSDKNYAVSCCPSGVVTGVASTDLGNGSDYTDAVSAVCRNSAGENVVVGSDFTHSPGVHACKTSETFIGVYAKDSFENNDLKDELDGVTAICKNNKSGDIRRVSNKDISGGREGTELTKTNVKIIGIAYKEMAKGHSDRADCVTLITK